MSSVLIIDDNKAIRLVLSSLLKLQLQSPNIFLSEEGVQGLGYAFITKPDLIVVDLTLPKYSGREIIDYLITNEGVKNRSTKVIVLQEDTNKSITDKKLPECFTVLNKKDKDFIEKFSKEVSDTFHLHQESGKHKFYNKIFSKIIHLSNKVDIANEDREKKRGVSKLLMLPKLLALDLALSLYITTFFLFFERKLKESKVEGLNKDLESYRIRTYPALALGMALTIFSFIGLLSLATGVGVITMFTTREARAASTRIWDGGGITNNWSDCANWDGPDICPIAGDTVTFNATSTKNSTVDATFGGSIGVVNINAGYTGVMTQARSLTVTSTFTTSAGTYTAAGQTLSVASTFTMNAGSIFTASSGTTTFSADFTINGGTFNNNGGTITFDGGSNTLSCNSISFNSVTINAAGVKTINSNCNLPLGSSPTITRIILNGTISGTGTLTVTGGQNTYNAGGVLSGFSGFLSGTVNFSGMTADFSSYSSFTTNTLTMTAGTINLPNGATLNQTTTISGGTLNAPSGTLIISAALTISGSAIFNANGGTVNFSGSTSAVLSCNNVTFNLVSFAGQSGTKTVSSNCSLPLGNNPTVPNGIDLNGTLSGSGTLTIGTFTLNASAVLSGFSGLITNAVFTVGTTLNLGSYTTVTFNSTFALSSGTFTAPSGIMNVVGNLTFTGGTFNANGGTINVIGSSTPTFSCNNATFNLVTLNQTAGNVTVSSNCNLPLGNNPTMSRGPNVSGTLSGTGTLTLTAGTLTLNAGAALSGFSGFIDNGVLTIAGATINFGSYSTVDLNSTFNLSSGTFTAPSGTMTLAGALTISGSPTFNANGGTITFDGATAVLSCNNVTFNLTHISHTSGTKTVNNNCNLPLGSNPTLGTGLSTTTVVLNGGTITGTGILSTGIFTLNAGSAITGFSGLAIGSNLTVQGATVDFSSYSSFAVNNFGTTTLSSGSLALPSGAHLTSSLTISGGTFTAPVGTLTLDGTLTISGSPTFNANGGTVSFAGAITAVLSCNNVTFSHVSFNHTAGLKTVNSNCNLPLGNNPNLTASVTLNGTLTGTGTLSGATNTTSLVLNAGAVLSGFSGMNMKQLALSGATIDFSSYSSFSVSVLFTINSGNITLPNGTDINSQLGLNGGTLNAPSGTMSIAGNFLVSGSPTFNANGGTIDFDGTGATLTCNNVIFSHVIVSGQVKNIGVSCTLPLGNNPVVGLTPILSGTLTGTGLLTTGGTFVVNAATAVLSGFSGINSDGLNVGSGTLNLTSYSPVTVNGLSINSGATLIAPAVIGSISWFNNAGTFNANNGTMIFNATGTGRYIVGTNIFNNLQILGNAQSPFQFTAGATTTVTGALTIDGSGNTLSLESFIPGTQWNLDVSNATSVDVANLSVTDSHSLNHVINTAGLNVANGGNNINWNFNNPEVSNLGPTNLVDGSFTPDNTPKLTFKVLDPDSGDTVKYQIQIDNNSDFSSPVVDYTSSIGAQGDKSFTVGQALSSGTYTKGKKGQILSDGTYYLRIRGIDNNNSIGAYNTANSGGIAFKIDTTGPTGSLEIEDNPKSSDPLSVRLLTKATDSGSGVSQMQVSLYSDFHDFPYQNYADHLDFNFFTPGAKQVFVRYKDNMGNVSQVYSQGLILILPSTTISTVPATTPTATGTAYELHINVVDQKDKKVLGAKVEVFSNPVTATTDKDGNVIFKNIPAGEHTIKVTYKNATGESKVILQGSDKVIQIKIVLLSNSKDTVSLYLLILILLFIILFLIFWKRRKKKKPESKVKDVYKARK